MGDDKANLKNEPSERCVVGDRQKGESQNGGNKKTARQIF